MKKLLLFAVVLLQTALSFGQLNMTLTDQLDYAADANDIWGWVAPDGTEYAIIGLTNGTSVVSLADPYNIVEVYFAPGANSTWRDIKTWGNYAYVTNETANGIAVIDLSGAPNNISHYDWTPNIPSLGQLTTCHNLYIDEFGWCYLAGCNLNSGGILYVDVFTTPGTPVYVNKGPAIYNHDVYARGNKMYSSEIYGGDLGIYNVANKANTIALGSTQTPFQFTHNAWLSDDGNVCYTTDERADAPVAAYDVSDPTNIRELDQFRPLQTLGTGVIPHNVHVWDDWLIISYYSDGGIIADASRPTNIIEVGNFDTFFGGGAGFNGAWGAYPFLPSGLVLVSSIANGLFVLDATYVRACWLEGEVTNSVTGAPILGASVSIESTIANAGSTNALGIYATGLPTAGTYDVTYSAVGYMPKTISVDLTNGVLTIEDVALDPLASYAVVGNVVNANTGAPVSGAQVVITNLDLDATFTTTTNANGEFSLNSVFQGNYSIVAGAWGYLYGSVSNQSVNAPVNVTIALRPGYQDDFVFDYQWTTSNTSPTGLWTLGEPVGTTQGNAQSNTDVDVDGDFGDQCYVTGNLGGGAGLDDVDGGFVVLRSPVMDLSTYADPVLSYRSWFFNAGGSGTPNDSMVVAITNGVRTVTVEKITNSASAWRPATNFHVRDFIEITNSMRVVFTAYDNDPGHLVEGAVDVFSVRDLSTAPTVVSNVQSGCSPLSVTFNFLGADTLSVDQWLINGEPQGTGNSLDITFIEGTYNVVAVVNDGNGNLTNVTLANAIEVNGLPTAAFTSTMNGTTIALNNTSTNATTYSWTFGDGSSSTMANPTHMYSTPGDYVVILTATNACGSTTSSFTISVTSVNDRLLSDAKIHVFPNPTSADAQITYELPSSSTRVVLEMTNLLGQVIFTQRLPNFKGTTTIPMATTASGIYLVRLVVDEHMTVPVKVVKH